MNDDIAYISEDLKRKIFGLYSRHIDDNDLDEYITYIFNVGDDEIENLINENCFVMTNTESGGDEEFLVINGREYETDSKGKIIIENVPNEYKNIVKNFMEKGIVEESDLDFLKSKFSYIGTLRD